MTSILYNEYRNFLNVFTKAKKAYTYTRFDIVDHFVDITDMIDISKGRQRQAADVQYERL